MRRRSPNAQGAQEGEAVDQFLLENRPGEGDGPGRGRPTVALSGRELFSRYLDIGDALILVPGGVTKLRRELLEGIPNEDWENARSGFGDRDLANE